MRTIIFNPTLEERKLGGYYFESVECDNCCRAGNWMLLGIDVMIKKGTLIPKGYSKKLKCPNCGCKTLKII